MARRRTRKNPVQLLNPLQLLNRRRKLRRNRGFAHAGAVIRADYGTHHKGKSHVAGANGLPLCCGKTAVATNYRPAPGEPVTCARCEKITGMRKKRPASHSAGELVPRPYMDVRANRKRKANRRRNRR